MTLAIDCSNYTGPVSLGQAQAAVGAGVGRVQIGGQYPAAPYPPGQAEQQVAAFLAAGAELEPYFESTPIAEAWTHFEPWKTSLRRPWLAVEPDSGFETLEAIREGLLEADALGIGSCGLYTSSWALGQLGLDLSEFADRDLWWAGYNGRLDLAMMPFSGWSSCVMHQFEGGATFAGIPTVDVSWYEEVATVALDIHRAVNADAIADIQAAMRALVTNDQQFIGDAQGPGVVTLTVPQGYRAIVALVKEG